MLAASPAQNDSAVGRRQWARLPEVMASICKDLNIGKVIVFTAHWKKGKQTVKFVVQFTFLFCRLSSSHACTLDDKLLQPNCRDPRATAEGYCAVISSYPWKFVHGSDHRRCCSPPDYQISSCALQNLWRISYAVSEHRLHDAKTHGCLLGRRPSETTHALRR